MQNMMTKLKFAALSAALMAIPATGALAFSKKVKDACAGDYQDFCSQYVPESTQARRCFESNHKTLSRPCIRALVDAGEVPSKYRRK